MHFEMLCCLLQGDSRYLLSNSKDQCIKLWDMRNFSSQDAQDVSNTQLL